MGLIFFFGDYLWNVSILSSIFTKISKGLSKGIMFLSIFFRRSFFRFLVSFPVFDLLRPGSPDKSFHGFRESKDTCVDFELLLLPSFGLFSNQKSS